MSAETKTCENEKCGAEFHRNSRKEGVAEFKLRRFCQRSCWADRGGKSAKQRKPAKLTEPVPEPARIVDGIWRPNAVGWPDQPRITAVAA